MQTLQQEYEDVFMEVEEDGIAPSGFTIDSDSKADWALMRISENEEQAQRIIRLCEEKIEYYTAMKENTIAERDRKNGGLKAMLRSFFEQVSGSHRVSKTQRKYGLATGTLVLKHHAPKVERDDEKLVEWLVSNGLKADFTKWKVVPRWDELKKSGLIEQREDGYITADGKKVEGVTLIPQEDTFDVTTL